MFLRLTFVLAAIALATGCGTERGWVERAQLEVARQFHTSTLLPSGDVLVVGGGTATAELYNPSTDSWRPAAHLSGDFTGHDALVLTSGEVVVTGGPSGAWSLYEPRTNVWVRGGFSNISTLPVRAALLPSDKVLLVRPESSEVLDPASGTVVVAAPLTVPREGFSLTRLASGKILAAGGRYLGSGASSSDAEIFDPEAGAWTSTGSMTQLSWAHTATLLTTGEVLVTESGSRTAEVFDPTSGSWRTTGTMVQVRGNHTATLLPGGHVLVAGGTTVNGQTESFDPLTEKWTVFGPLRSPRYAHAAALLESGEVMICGGVDANGTILGSVEVYTSPAEERPGYDPHRPACAGGLANGTATAFAVGLLCFAAARRRRRRRATTR